MVVVVVVVVMVVVVVLMVVVLVVVVIITRFPVYGPVNVISNEYWCFLSFEAVEMKLKTSPVMKLYNNHEMDQ